MISIANVKKLILASTLGILIGVASASMASASVSTTYTYDALGRIITVTRIVGGTTYVVYYTYDAAGNRTSVY